MRQHENFSSLNAKHEGSQPFWYNQNIAGTIKTTNAFLTSTPILVSDFRKAGSHLSPYDFYTNDFGQRISGSTSRLFVYS